MPGLDPGIHAFPRGTKDVDGGDEPGHDDAKLVPSSNLADLV